MRRGHLRDRGPTWHPGGRRNAGGSDAQLVADQNACRQQAIGQADTKSLPTWGQTINREAYDDCMRARGYDVDSASARPRR